MARGHPTIGLRAASISHVSPLSSGRGHALPTDVEHVAYLARLGLTDEELARLEGQLNHILDQYAMLAELDTEDIPPTAQTIELENILRDDVARRRCRSRTSCATRRDRRRVHRRARRSSAASDEADAVTA